MVHSGGVFVGVLHSERDRFAGNSVLLIWLFFQINRDHGQNCFFFYIFLHSYSPYTTISSYQSPKDSLSFFFPSCYWEHWVSSRVWHVNIADEITCRLYRLLDKTANLQTVNGKDRKLLYAMHVTLDESITEQKQPSY